MTDDSPALGVVGGIGVAAAIRYYKGIVAAQTSRGFGANLILTHASLATVGAYLQANDYAGLALYLASHIQRHADAGARISLVAAVAPHACARELRALSPLPFIDLAEATQQAVADAGLSRVALIGTRYVVGSDLFGHLAGRTADPREDEINDIHKIYSLLASTGNLDEPSRARIREILRRLATASGADAVVLAGTDLSGVIDDRDTSLPILDCVDIHIAAAMKAIEAPPPD